MKILYIHSNSALDNGASLSLIALIKHVKEQGIEVIVVIPSEGMLLYKLRDLEIETYIVRNYNDWYYNIKNGLNIRTKTISFMKSILNQLAKLRIAMIILTKKIDVVHINTLTNQIGAKAALLTKRKLVWHIREYLEEDLGITHINLKKSISLYNKADSMIAISRGVYSKYNKLINTKIHTIYNGVDNIYYNSNKNILMTNYINITLAGRIVREKGQLEMLKATKLLVDKGHKNIRLKIIGKNNNDAYYKSLIEYVKENELENNVSIKDYSSNMHEIWQATDIACVCSLSEAFGRVTVEAMLEGILVIGANTGGTAEIIEDSDTGFLYSQGNHYDLANIIDFSIKHPSVARRIALQGQQKALKKYTSSKNASNIINLYKNLI